MADAEVRDARLEDAAEIARIQVDTWRTAYSDLLPVTVLEQLDPQHAREEWEYTLRHGPAEVLLATEGPWTVGFCAVGPAPESEIAAANGEVPGDAGSTILLSVLLVEPRWGRRGHGGRLLGTAAQRRVARGATRGITWIPESDPASMAFFRRAGWDPDGTVRTLEAGGHPLRELRLSGGLDLELRS